MQRKDLKILGGDNMMPIKNEMGHKYGPFKVVEKSDIRDRSNGCVRWVCFCDNCGYRYTANGNSLRFGNIRKYCPKCGCKS